VAQALAAPDPQAGRVHLGDVVVEVDQLRCGMCGILGPFLSSEVSDLIGASHGVTSGV
jgi:hypothetical protein